MIFYVMSIGWFGLILKKSNTRYGSEQNSKGIPNYLAQERQRYSQGSKIFPHSGVVKERIRSGEWYQGGRCFRAF